MLFYQLHPLRLQYREHSVDFLANEGSLRQRLHAAFLSLNASYTAPKATLLVRHPLHGWLKVCDAAQRYPIINNPLLLDYPHLSRAVRHTLAEASSWPSEEEKERRKQERAKRRRAETARARRKRFHLV